jgi:hypothetical protein
VRLRRILFSVASIGLLIISCDVSTLAISQPVIPTQIPGALNFLIAQTAGAAATQTAALIPPTLTPSLTPFPTFTPPDTDTPTPTFIFILLIPTSSGSGGGSGSGSGSGLTSGTAGKEYACTRGSKSPANGTSFNPGQKFTGDWKVKNSGTIDWVITTVDFDFVSGSGSVNFSSPSSTLFDFSSTVAVGSSVTLTVPMKAPASAGSYTSNWTLAASHKTFCTFSWNITVK